MAGTLRGYLARVEADYCDVTVTLGLRIIYIFPFPTWLAWELLILVIPLQDRNTTHKQVQEQRLIQCRDEFQILFI